MRIALLLMAGFLLAANVGCSGINLARRGCNSCGGHGCQVAHSGGCQDGSCGGGHMGHGRFAGNGGGGCPDGACGDGGNGGYGGGGHGGGMMHAGTRGTPGVSGHHQHREFHGPAGPAAATVAYPYYTTRGPRDFLMDNPPSIGN